MTDKTAEAQPKPLSGFCVVDLGRVVAGPFCGMLLGDLGADVIKVESVPDGDFIRYTEPSFAPTIGSYFATANRNKRSIMLNLRSDGGKKALRALLAKADVVIENFRPGTMEAMGFGPDTLERDYPSLIVTRIAAYGHVGPKKNLPGVDQIIQGVSGMMSITGSPEIGPIRHGIAICDILAAMSATIGVLGALMARANQGGAASGGGQLVQTSLLQAALGTMSVQAGKFFATGEAPIAEGNHHPVISPYGLFPTADGHVQFNVFGNDKFQTLSELCGHPEWAEDPRFSSPSDRSTNKTVLRDLVTRETPRMSTEEWLDALTAADIPCGPILDVKQAFEDEQAEALGMTLRTTLGDGSPVLMPGFLAQLSKTPMTLEAPPPFPGEHSAKILIEIGLADDPEVLEAAGLTSSA